MYVCMYVCMCVGQTIFAKVKHFKRKLRTLEKIEKYIMSILEFCELMYLDCDTLLFLQDRLIPVTAEIYWVSY